MLKLLKNKVTRNAIIFTFFILLIYRIGFYIITPLIDGTTVIDSSGGDALNVLFNFMGGGNLNQLSLFALGVSPYITASIVIQLLENDLVPKMAEWKHQGVDGQNKRSNWTKYLAVVFAILQAAAIVFGFNTLQSNSLVASITPGGTAGLLEYVLISLFITAGTTVLIWLSDRITEKGIGNGMSVVIMAGILSRIPVELNGIYAILQTAVVDGMTREAILTILMWVGILFLTLLLIIGVIVYTLAERRIGINYVKSSKGKESDRSYLPIRLNPAGVIPVIFVVPLMQIPSLIVQIPAIAANGHGSLEKALLIPFDLTTANNYWWVAVIVYFLLVVVFSVMYSYIQMNPEQMAENLEKQSAYIIGVRPGNDTVEYLTKVISRTTLLGGSFLGILAVLPTILSNVLNLQGVSLQLIGTGLIITVNVLVQTYQSLSNKAESKTYKKLV